MCAVLTVGYLKDIGAVQVESWNHTIFSSNKKAVSLQTSTRRYAIWIRHKDILLAESLISSFYKFYEGIMEEERT